MSAKQLKILAVAAIITVSVAVPPSFGDNQVAEPRGIVDCLLPGAIRRVGGSIYQMPGRPVRTIASECKIRGGDYLLFDRANYDSSLKHWISLAETGDEDAMLYVGEIYEKGLGRAPDYASAAEWYRKAADSGNTTAMISLAHLYKTGQGVELDLQAAQALYSRAFGSDIPIPLDPTSVKGADQRIETLIAEVDAVRRQKIAVELELEAANEQLAAARASLDDALAGDGENTERLNGMRATVTRQETEISDYRSRLEALQAENDELRTLRAQLEDKEIETEKLKELLSAVEADFERTRDLLSEQRHALAQKEAEFSELLANMSTERDRQELQASTKDIQAQRSRIAELEAALRKAEEEKVLYEALADDAATQEDRMATLNARIGILERQSDNRTTEFEAMQAALAESRAALEAQTQAAAEAEQASEEELARRNAEIERLRAAVARAENESNRHRGDIDRLADQSAEFEKLRANLEREQAQSNRLQQLLSESQDRFVESNNRLAELTAARERLELDIATLRENAGAGSEASRAELEQREADLLAARDEVDRLQARISESEAEFSRYQLQMSDTASRQTHAIEDLRAAVAQSRAERAQLEEKLLSANAQIENAQADLEIQRRRYTELQDELRESRAERKAGADELQRKQAQLDDEQQRVARLQAEVARLQQQSDRYEVQLTELQHVAQAQKVEFAGPTIVLLEPEEPSLLAVQAAAGSTARTRGISVVAATKAGETRFIKGRVDAPAGLAQLTINDWDIPFDAHNAFTQTLKLDGEKKHIRIVAVDHNGNQAVKEFEYQVNGAAVAAEVHDKKGRFEQARNSALDELRYYALLIANEDYEDDFVADLRTPVADVEAIGRVLRERYGFDVDIMHNATKEDLEVKFERIFYHEESDADNSNDKDALLIYYAGHGYGSDSRMDNAYFWVPVDARNNSPRTWFETRQIERYMKNSMVKQIMVVADSCFAGKVLSRDGEGMLPVSEESAMWEKMLYEYTQEKRSRFVLTSGGNAPVLDGGGGNHSVFARSLLTMLERNEKIISAHTLFEGIAGKVMYLAEKQNFEQEPEFGHLRSAGHESGVFYMPAPLFPANMAATSRPAR